MEKAHALYLVGMEIDWLDGLNNRGFTFNNPNAKRNLWMRNFLSQRDTLYESNLDPTNQKLQT